jgi:hypothetical protein
MILIIMGNPPTRYFCENPILRPRLDAALSDVRRDKYSPRFRGVFLLI